MVEIVPLIRSAVRSARELNRMLVAELRAQRALELHHRALGRTVPRAWHHHDDAIWQLRNGRDDCMKCARGLRRLASYVSFA